MPLNIVSTPIGNLGDITYRAVEIIASSDLVLSEDTRETAKILEKFNIKVPQISYTDQKHSRLVDEIINLLKSGKSISLVSDSGTPLISDPGFKLIQNCIKEGIQLESIPGPSSVTTALTLSGLPTDKFVFLGFLPKNKNQQRKILESYGALDATLTIFESPYRIAVLLQVLFEVLGDRYVCIAKDLTKVYQDIKRGLLSEILKNNDIKPKGEYIVLVSKKGYNLNGSANI